MLPSFDYVKAGSIEDAVRRLGSKDARIHAGGTDLLGCLRDRVFGAASVVSLGALDELRGIEPTSDGGLRIGAMTTISEIAASRLVRDRYPGLAAAAATVASPQLRNQGTLGGNLCQRPRCWYYRGEFHCTRKGGDRCYAFGGENRYHAIFGGGPCFIVHPSDTAPMLVALEALIRITGPDGDRSVRAEEFFVLPDQDVEHENVLAAGEIVTEVLLPADWSGVASRYRKIRERCAWDFALVSVALAARLDEDRVLDSRVVLGGVAPIPWRSAAAEQAIGGERLEPATAARAARAAVADAAALEQNGYKVPLLRAALEQSLTALV